MSEFTKQYQEFFRDSEAGQRVIADLEAAVQAEYANASNSTDLQDSFAHLQRAKGVQMAVSKIHNLLVEVKKPR